LIGPDGSVLWRGHPALLDPELEKAMKEHPPQLVDPAVLASANTLLDTVDQSISSKNYTAAIKTLAKVPAAAHADPQFAARQDASKKALDDAAKSMLDEVTPLVADKKYVEAATKLKAIAAALDGSPTAAEAKRRLSDLRKDPAASAAIEAADRSDKADAALQLADQMKADKHDPQAYAKYKSIVKEFAGTPAAVTAAGDVKAYDADPVFAKQTAATAAAADATKAKGLLSLANSFLSAGNTELAKKKFAEVVEKYPTTPQAAEAKEALAKIPD
jgi:TolA-binding protein